MSGVTLAFYRGRGDLLDRVIRWVTRSPYSHVEIIALTGQHDGTAREARSLARDLGKQVRLCCWLAEATAERANAAPACPAALEAAPPAGRLASGVLGRWPTQDCKRLVCASTRTALCWDCHCTADAAIFMFHLRKAIARLSAG